MFLSRCLVLCDAAYGTQTGKKRILKKKFQLPYVAAAQLPIAVCVCERIRMRRPRAVALQHCDAYVWCVWQVLETTAMTRKKTYFVKANPYSIRFPQLCQCCVHLFVRTSYIQTYDAACVCALVFFFFRFLRRLKSSFSHTHKNIYASLCAAVRLNLLLLL